MEPKFISRLYNNTYDVSDFLLLQLVNLVIVYIRVVRLFTVCYINISWLSAFKLNLTALILCRGTLDETSQQQDAIQVSFLLFLYDILIWRADVA